MAGLDLLSFGQTGDVQVVILPNEEGLWLTIIQEAAQELDDVPILEGFSRTSVELPPPPGSIH